MKTVLNKWQVEISVKKDYQFMDRGWKKAIFGIFKIHTKPEEGMMFTKNHYKGFRFSFYIWFPIDR